MTHNSNTTFENTSEINTFTDPYKDPEDPNEEQIRKATESIILNDITEQVVEDKYDKADIVTETITNN